jgi:hypothetical protein
MIGRVATGRLLWPYGNRVRMNWFLTILSSSYGEIRQLDPRFPGMSVAKLLPSNVWDSP